MQPPDSQRSPWTDRWGDAASHPADLRAAQGRGRGPRRRRSRHYLEDGRCAADVDGNEEQERQQREAEAPSSKIPASSPPSSKMDSSAWVAALPFTSEELEDTWPDYPRRTLFDDER